MAERPWRCSQCGTINEASASSCRNCGKWPSLFDLEDNAVDEGELEPVADAAFERAPATTFEPPPEPVTVEPEPYEPETFEPAEPTQRERRFGPPPTRPVLEDGEAEGRHWLSWLVPIAFVVYLAISWFFSSR